MNGSGAPAAAAAAAAATATAATAPPTDNDADQVRLSLATIDPRVVAADYAVRGEIVKRAQTIAEELEAYERAAAAHARDASAAPPPKRPYPFDKCVWCNIGNPQILGQPPMSFFRQVLSLCEYPALLKAAEQAHAALVQEAAAAGAVGTAGRPSPPAGSLAALYPRDAVARAREFMDEIPGGVGAYSDSAGALVLRRQIAAAVARRDGGIACDPDDLFLTDGASPAVHYAMEMLVRDARDAFLVPIPQYPLYSAALTLQGGELVPYWLDEDRGWALDVGQLDARLHEARARGLRVRGLVVINPGNPTGQCLSLANMRDVAALCEREQLVLIADEVYQTNVYVGAQSDSSSDEDEDDEDEGERPAAAAAASVPDESSPPAPPRAPPATPPRPPRAGPPAAVAHLLARHARTNSIYDSNTFVSFKRVVREGGCSFPLMSLHSTSKGFVGECGRRGGYVEVVNFPRDVRDQVLKLASINLCPNVSGQICCALMMTPPPRGSPSHAQYARERDAVLGSLARRARTLVAALNALEGVSCRDAEGALYAFPRLRLPPRAVEEARALGKPADWLYCMRLVESTGVVAVPGSGFGQADGTWHFRTTFLPPEGDIPRVVAALARFHADFLARYGGLPPGDEQDARRARALADAQRELKRRGAVTPTPQ
jgi:alanine transaminase